MVTGRQHFPTETLFDVLVLRPGRLSSQYRRHSAAFDAAIGLARSGKLLLSEALAVRGRAAAGRNGAGGSGLHWDEETGKQRLAEVMGRMQGPREVLERALGLS